MSTAKPASGVVGQDWTYDSIVRKLHERRILLRVHASPACPLLGSHNDEGSAGFTARNLAFRGLTAEQYAQATSSLRQERDWAEGPYMRQVIIDHINQCVPPPRAHHRKGPGHFLRPRPAADDLSPWISTTGNLDWALWYIARLLCLKGHKRVRLAIIDATRTPHTPGGELRLRPFAERPKGEWINLPRREKDRYLRASWAAGEARETLFYGRVFGESILSDMVFDVSVRPPPFSSPTSSIRPPQRALALTLRLNRHCRSRFRRAFGTRPVCATRPGQAGWHGCSGIPPY